MHVIQYDSNSITHYKHIKVYHVMHKHGWSYNEYKYSIQTAYTTLYYKGGGQGDDKSS